MRCLSFSARTTAWSVTGLPDAMEAVRTFWHIAELEPYGRQTRPDIDDKNDRRKGSENAQLSAAFMRTDSTSPRQAECTNIRVPSCHAILDLSRRLGLRKESREIGHHL